MLVSVLADDERRRGRRRRQGLNSPRKSPEGRAGHASWQWTAREAAADPTLNTADASLDSANTADPTGDPTPTLNPALVTDQPTECGRLPGGLAGLLLGWGNSGTCLPV